MAKTVVKLNLAMPDDRILHAMVKQGLIIGYYMFAHRSDNCPVFKVHIDDRKYDEFRRVYEIWRKFNGMKKSTIPDLPSARMFAKNPKVQTIYDTSTWLESWLKDEKEEK